MRKPKGWTEAVGAPAKAEVALSTWSISRLHDWERCPRYAMYRHGLKLPEPKGPALERGIAVHALAEAYLKAEEPPRRVPAELSKFAPQFRALRKKEAQSEVRFAVTEKWEPRGFFDRDVWLRCVADALVIDGDKARIVDFKTGKKRDGYDDQLELYAVSVFLHFPEVESVQGELWFLDTGEIVKVRILRDRLEELLAAWTVRPLPMLEDRIFPSRPGWYCRYCHYRRDNAGPCEH